LSSSYVREKFRQWAVEVQATTGDVFHSTINTAENPTDSIWWTAQFVAEFNEGTFCKRPFMETGFIVVIAVARAGLGDLEAIRMLERVIPELLAKVDPTQRLVLETHDPIRDETAGSADRSFRVSVSIDYRHSL
jgi:hypothetical protein